MNMTKVKRLVHDVAQGGKSVGAERLGKTWLIAFQGKGRRVLPPGSRAIIAVLLLVLFPVPGFPQSTDRSVTGTVTDRKTGKAYLFMDNIDNHEIDTVILHEVGIHMLGDDAFMNQRAQGLATHVMRHANMYGDLPKQGMTVFKGYDFNTGKMNADQEEWVANALSAVMASRGSGFRGFLDWMAGVAKNWYTKLTGGKYEPRPEAFVNMAESQLRNAIANGRAAKRGDDKVLFYTAMRDEDAAGAVANKVPKSVRKTAINAQNRFFKTGLGMMFTKDLVDYAKSKGLMLYLGEFGCMVNCGENIRLAWLKDVVDLARQNNIPYALWEYSAQFGFADRWNKGKITNQALMDVLVK